MTDTRTSYCVACKEMADRIEALEAMVTQLQVDSEPSPYCPICGSCGEDGCCGSKRCLYPDTWMMDRIEALEAEIERLREALREMPEPHEYLGPVDLRLIRSYIDARRTWRHKHRAALEGTSHE